MKVTNGDIWQAKEPLQKLAKEPLPWRTSYALAQLVKQLNDQLMVIVPVKDSLVQQYGGVGSRGQMEINPEHSTWPEFSKAFGEFMAEEVEIKGEPVKVVPSNGWSPSVAEIMALEPFVELVVNVDEMVQAK